MRLYALVIRLLRLLTSLYFVEIRATGREHVPERGPLILAANHPSSILDSIVMATQIKRPIHYLARSGLFRFRPLATLFRWLGAVPIYRAHEVANAAERNEQIFHQVFDLLEAGRCIGVFPEGTNSPPTRIGPLRKGTARIALAAEARREGVLGLKVVPVGVNFENRGFLTSAVLLRFGPPIEVRDHLAAYQQDEEAALKALTDAIKNGLHQQVLTLEDSRLKALVDDLAQVFGDTLSQRFGESAVGLDGQELPRQRLLKRWAWQMAAWYRRTTPESARAFERRMVSRQHIRDVLVNSWMAEPRRVVALRKRLDRYKDHLGQTELRDALVQSRAFDTPVKERLIRLRMTLYACLVAPLALFGLVHNLLPYGLARLGGRFGRDEAVRAFSLFLSGIVAFGAAYSLIGVWLWRYTDFTLVQTFIYLALLPPTGFAALSYRRKVLIFRDRILLRTLFFNRRELVDLLRASRRQLHEEFMELADRYGPD
ncbi:MAG: 1-acyl-sn-glycerol-3-phosphate acyltransferase [Wenzhouxiangella sp.]